MSFPQEKVIILGDLHLGIKRFSLAFLDNQLRFFNEELFPYMKENNISKIYQLGDLFDNRTTCDIMWFEKVKEQFFDKLVEHEITLYTLLGNHDIVLRESRDFSLINTIESIYDNVKVFKERTEIMLCGRKTYIVPWITKDESLRREELEGKEIVLGHFEIRNFSMVKGHIDTTSELTEGFFKENKIDFVFSGHYHIKNTYGDIKYLGVPFQLNWNDFNCENGFYVWDGFDLDFFENTVSKKFIKIKYNDGSDGSHPIAKDNIIEIEGLHKSKLLLTEEEFKDKLPLLENHELKFFINHAKDRHFDEVLYAMKEAKVLSTVINNQEISKIIGADYVSKFENLNNIEIENSRQIILDTVKEHKESLVPLMLDILSEIDSIKNKGV